MNSNERLGYALAMRINARNEADGFSNTEQIESLQDYIKNSVNEDIIKGFNLAFEDIKRWWWVS